jgi:hypothetical protein
MGERVHGGFAGGDDARDGAVDGYAMDSRKDGVSTGTALLVVAGLTCSFC